MKKDTITFIGRPAMVKRFEKLLKRSFNVSLPDSEIRMEKINLVQVVYSVNHARTPYFNSAEALELMKDEPYKVELINDLPEDATISFYRQGDFTDLCAGPHLPSTGKVKAVKLTSIAGAYWRGSEKNKMLQRIYGTAFATKEELDAYVAEREEALKRDHNKLGRDLEYFTTVDVVGQGLPIMLPKGARFSFCSAGWRTPSRRRATCLPRRR